MLLLRSATYATNNKSDPQNLFSEPANASMPRDFYWMPFSAFLERRQGGALTALSLLGLTMLVLMSIKVKVFGKASRQSQLVVNSLSPPRPPASQPFSDVTCSPNSQFPLVETTLRRCLDSTTM